MATIKSIEEKAKAYDKVVSKLKGFIMQGVDPLITRNDVQDFFPELRESEDARVRNRIIQALHGDVLEMSEIKEAVAWLEKQGEQKPAEVEPRQEQLTEFEKAVKQVMEEAIECGDTHNLKADADMLLRLVQKPAVWSNEDIELLDNTIKFIEDRVAATSPSLRTYSPTLTGKEIPFLKALKDRVQPKQEWSEEDEKMIDFAIRAVGLCKQYAINHQVNGYSKLPDVPKRYEELQNWLKSLKDRDTWKPSDEQMEALRKAEATIGVNHVVLAGLISDLEKLTE